MSLPRSLTRTTTPASRRDVFDRANTNTEKMQNHYRLFALIIGINQYQRKEDFSSLRGAVPDGKEFRHYLTTRLRVPEDQISTLFDEEATRSAIIKAFQDLNEDPRINRGDPIFIFYAGHGGQKRPHPDWNEPNEKIEVIVPYDCTSDGSVEPIPDRTIGLLIDEIARKKGDNITVVFDCCNSASATRSGGATLVRSVFLGDLVFDRNTDRDIWDSHHRGARLHDGHSHRGLRSHILISACSSFEEAVEHEGRGRLSVALLKLLDKVSPHQLRNCDILPNIEPIPKQNPQCQGHAQTRLLFDGKIVLSSRLYPIKVDSKRDTSEYTLTVGRAQGIAIGAEFEVYRDADKMLKKPLGTLIVHKLADFSAEMKLPGGSSLALGRPIPALLARQTKAGKLASFFICIPPGDSFHSLYHRIRHRSNSNLKDIYVFTKSEAAHLKIWTSPRNHLLVIEITDNRVTRYGVKVVADQVKPDPDNVSWILQRAAHYHRELNRTSPEHNITAEDRISVGFFRLDPPKIPPFDWTTANLKCIGPNLYHNKSIDFVVEDEETPYGVSITNGTGVHLYVNAFFFDNTNFAILPYYTTDCANGPHLLEPPLKRGGTLTLGYGSGGAPPHKYPIRKGHDTDVGFLKIYLSTKPCDLSGIIQDDAFTQTRAADRWSPNGMVDTWDTILIPVIQRRKSRYSGTSGRSNNSLGGDRKWRS